MLLQSRGKAKTSVNNTIQFIKPIYPHGTILHYQISAMENSSDIMTGRLNIYKKALEISITMLPTGSGTYLVKVYNIYVLRLLFHEF